MVLRIAAEHPVAFQERIRAQFPQVDIGQGMEIHIAPLGAEPPSATPKPRRIFRFKSPAGNTIVSLATDFYALSTTSYTHWADFLNLLELVNQAACDVYELPYAVRVGLRYINFLTFSNTGASSTTELWEILRPELTVSLRGDCWDEPLEMNNRLLLAAGEDGNERLTLRSGFRGGGEPVLLLDFDYFAEGSIALENLAVLCQRYHDVIYNAFRWCIREGRLVVFSPVPVTEED